MKMIFKSRSDMQILTALSVETTVETRKMSHLGAREWKWHAGLRDFATRLTANNPRQRISARAPRELKRTQPVQASETTLLRAAENPRQPARQQGAFADEILKLRVGLASRRQEAQNCGKPFTRSPLHLITPTSHFSPFTSYRFSPVAAFNLAEVLITLGIIGIIAAYTIPTLLNNIEDAQLKTAFKKAYSTASQAWQQAVEENPSAFVDKSGWDSGCVFPDGTTGSVSAPDGRAEAIKSKMKVIKSCINESGCWASAYENNNALFGGSSYLPSRYGWVTTDGMCWAAPYKGLDDGILILDTNCAKNPNKMGQDMFSFMLGVDGVIYFSLDNKSPNGKPISSGLVCPYLTDPQTINGRSVSFKSWLYN